jgi:hypothetical protein
VHPEPVKILMQTIRFSRLLALPQSCIAQNLRISQQQERDKPQQHHHGAGSLQTAPTISFQSISPSEPLSRILATPTNTSVILRYQPRVPNLQPSYVSRPMHVCTSTDRNRNSYAGIQIHHQLPSQYTQKHQLRPVSHNQPSFSPTW